MPRILPRRLRGQIAAACAASALLLPKGTDWKGLELKAEIEVKGVGHPVRWACRQSLEEDGSLRLRPTRALG